MFKRLIKFGNNLPFAPLRHTLAHFTHRAETPLHVLYLSVVAVEAHGFYAYAAGAAGAVIVAAALLGQGGE